LSNRFFSSGDVGSLRTGGEGSSRAGGSEGSISSFTGFHSSASLSQYRLSLVIVPLSYIL